MKRKRINHQADIFCAMFSGWRLGDDVLTLSELGEGKLELDILTEKVKFNDKEFDKKLYVVGEISAFFRKDLEDNNIDIKDIISAKLKVTFKSTVIEGKPKSRTRKKINIKLDMHSLISTNEKHYEKRKKDIVEYHYIYTK